ncbi:MAG: hypothetical protein WD872_11455 [Pirellulaceae bacterium]
MFHVGGTHRRDRMADMTSISFQEILSDPGGFLRRVEAGESLQVIRNQLPVAEIKPVSSAASEPRPFGLGAGQFSVPASFDDPLPADLMQDFEGACG